MDRYLITGGAGFIGSNLAQHHLARGGRVTIFDSFRRSGAREYARWLLERFGGRLSVVEGDVRWPGPGFQQLVEEAQVVVHLAGQVAVTTSVAEPREDFEVNALGTLNVLEAVRGSGSRPIVLYSSTNKVYGKLAHVQVTVRDRRYAYLTHAHGVAESAPLDFHSPYGCSKGAGDQYVLDYARIYGLRTVVFRQSCIYGPRQFGLEDQGWVAWFAIQALLDRPVVIYGDGRQVRDVLYVDDLLAAYDAAVERIEVASGQAYNLGGGPVHTLSLLELIDQLQQRFGRPLRHSFDAWRPGDQRVYISDVRKARTDLGWQPRVCVGEGLDRLLAWLEQLHAERAPAPALVEAAGG